MNCLTWGELKKYVAEYENAKDSDPVYICIRDSDGEDGCEEGTLYALDTISAPCLGGHIEFSGYDGGMDEEDEENLL